MIANRRRPHITMTPAPETVNALRDIGRNIGIHSLGIILDYVMTDYLKLKHAATVPTPTDGDDHPDPIPMP